MIDPNEITTARVGELPPSPFELTDNIPHEIGETLFRGTVKQLGDVIGDYLGAVSGSSYNNTVVPDGGTLPDTTVKEWIFVGKGTFHNVGGQPDIITTEELNILSSNGTYWSLAVEIPIDVELAGITQNIRSGYTETTASEDKLFKEFALKANVSDIPVQKPIYSKVFDRLVADQQTFIIPEGYTAKWAVLNYGTHYSLETIENMDEPNTFTQTGVEVITKDTLVIGNQFEIFYQ